VIAPPYFPLDDEELLVHLAAAAAACAPLPFYAYEFAARSGYAISVGVMERLRAIAPNLAGMKVSDTPWEAVEPYLVEGLDLFVGSEPLALQGLARGAVGAVSALASAFPEIVAALVHERSELAGEQVTTLRGQLGPRPALAAIKEILGARGVPVRPDLRPPLRRLTPREREIALSAARAAGAFA
jgi:dihydrodipicolinate synthase/N-acetylneuraminate lyase